MMKPTKERLLALHIFSSAEMFRILETQQRRCYTWMRRLRIFRPEITEAALFWRGRSDQNYCVACRVVARCEDVARQKEVRLRPDYGATAFVLRYAASEDWNASTNDQDRLT
jgi:hypothetical protein